MGTEKKPSAPVIPGVTHCRRCHVKLGVWFIFPLCDSCIEWEITHLKTKGREPVAD